MLELINDYCQERGIEKAELPLNSKKKEKEPKEPKPDTKKISFDLFKMGKNISEIAKERNLTINTIENHLSFYIQNNDLDISLFLTDDKLSKIIAYFENAETKSLNIAREALGENFSYSEIKFVLAYLNGQSS
jgi:uncharacterized protein YpbB